MQRFNTELKNLKANSVKVELIKSRVSKGKILHKIQLSNALSGSVTEVLSEGESRIISIAGFLADVTSKDSKAPFIFDDPISSLDQNFEEAVIKRLISLSHDRQVIVFTHRMSFLTSIKKFSEIESIPLHIQQIQSVEWGTGEPTAMLLPQG